MDTYIIYKKTLAYELIAQGNTLLDKESNIKNNKYYKYIFLDDKKFRADLTTLTSK